MKALKFYLQHRTLYYVIWWFILVIPCLAAIFLLPDGRGECICGLILFVGTVLMVDLPIVWLRRLNQILIENCDPVSYLQQTDFLLSELDAAKKIYNPQRGGIVIQVFINRCTAFYDLERDEEALQIFRLLQNGVSKPLPSQYMRVIYHNLAYIYLRRGELPMASYYFEQEKAVWSQVNWFGENAALTKMLVPLLTEAAVLSYQGDFAHAEPLYVQAEGLLSTQKKPQRHAQVGIAFQVGEMYYRMGNFAEAAPRLQFAADNGGTTFYCARAKELLTAIQQMHTNANTDGSTRDIP